MQAISIIIPTYDRKEDLDECLNSIIIQTTLPEELIIVDDSNDDRIANLVELRENEFKLKKISLTYVRNNKERSLSISRNVGIQKARGDIILFLDSDVILDRNYIGEITRVYLQQPEALGVQGHIRNSKNVSRLSWFLNRVQRLFCLQFFETNKSRILPSFEGTYPSIIDKVVNCEWLSGSNQSFKKEILDEFKFDEKLKTYSLSEDQDLSYRIFKKNPRSLFMTPYATLIHKVSSSGKIPQKELIYMSEIYPLYMFFKNMDRNLKNILIYLWSRVGKVIVRVIALILRPSNIKLLEFKYLLRAYICCIKHVQEIKQGDLDFFNKNLYS